ncbi:hypothetical protein SH449x_000749 [Pirellulaceae bacterium SH449]
MSSVFDSETTAPVLERIADTILERVAAANIADVKINRPDREGRNFTPANRSISLHQLEVAWNETLSHEGNPPVMAYDVTFHLACFVRNQTEYENSYAAACNKIAAEVIRAITNPAVDPALWYNMDGLAINSEIGSQFPLPNEEGKITGVIVPLVVTYRVSENNHYEVRA